MPGPLDYAVTGDISAFLPNVPAAQQSTWVGLISTASRGIDDYCDRPGGFFSDSGGVKYFDVGGDASSGTAIRVVDLGLDFYGATTVKVAQRENADPAVGADWVTLAGDGITPPSDFFLEPANQPYVGKNGDAAKRPFSRIELPATSPSTSTTFQSTFMVGKRTLSVNPANWGWPSIPDRIKNVCVKVVIRMFKAQASGFAGVSGAPDIGAVTIARFLDLDDRAALDNFKRFTSA